MISIVGIKYSMLVKFIIYYASSFDMGKNIKICNYKPEKEKDGN